ncbi:required for respiratory growth protein 9, mitochondrial [Chaetomium fimeti]|uniref:Required for respiratory growth protein 9, mitochondrial n=1 Tax=Chaetomium fimeti TaxID=1854472 RepID=A0AAE0HBY8_9PEZI|nr:required for respiratory growth protein 9, mitochondrial [Chaetomium fimeti]
MDCSCRTAALRIFVRSVVQIHVPVRTTAPRATQYRALSTQPNRTYAQRTGSILATASRTLHTSCVRSGAAEATQSFERGGGRASRHNNRAANSHTSEPSAGYSFGSPSPNAHTRPTTRPRTYRSNGGDSGGRGQRYKPAGGTERETRRSRPKSNAGSGDWAKPNTKETWMVQKSALEKKFPEGWNPRKKLSPDALGGIRMLHKQFPDEYTTEVLAQKFEVSPEAIRRILRSNWTADPEKEAERQERWFNRGKKVWTQWAALGKKPPRKWRAEGIVRDPIWNKPRGPNHKDKNARAEAQRRLAKRGFMGGYMRG